MTEQRWLDVELLVALVAGQPGGAAGTGPPLRFLQRVCGCFGLSLDGGRRQGRVGGEQGGH